MLQKFTVKVEPSFITRAIVAIQTAYENEVDGDRLMDIRASQCVIAQALAPVARLFSDDGRFACSIKATFGRWAHDMPGPEENTTTYYLPDESQRVKVRKIQDAFDGLTFRKMPTKDIADLSIRLAGLVGDGLTLDYVHDSLLTPEETAKYSTTFAPTN